MNDVVRACASVHSIIVPPWACGIQILTFPLPKAVAWHFFAGESNCQLDFCNLGLINCYYFRLWWILQIGMQPFRFICAMLRRVFAAAFCFNQFLPFVIYRNSYGAHHDCKVWDRSKDMMRFDHTASPDDQGVQFWDRADNGNTYPRGGRSCSLHLESCNWAR
jgi:hypothetical protein